MRRMGSLSRQKGKRVEREAAKAVALSLGCEAWRSVQHSGSAGDADLKTTLEGVHFEVKARAAHGCIRFLEQAIRDSAQTGAVPVVLLREDGDPQFYVLARLADLRELSRRIDPCPSKMC